MKKNFTHTAIALACLLALASCHKQEGPALPISFGTVDTKAGATAENIKTEGSAFIVNGEFTQSGTGDHSLFDGTTVTWDSSKWTYSPIRYWAMTSSYRFRAAWPAEAFSGTGAASYSDDLTEGGAVISGFSVKSSPDEQIDLLVSSLVTAETDENGSPTPDKVYLDFKHILSDVQVYIKADDPSASIKVKGITVSGIKGYGSYAYSGSAYAWTASGESKSYSKAWSSPSVLSGSFPDSPQCELFMIPQVLSGGMAIQLTYSIGEGPDQIANLNTATDISWSTGTKYMYQISVATAGIEFTAKIVDWIDGGTITLTK